MKVFRPLNIVITALVSFVFWSMSQNMVLNTREDDIFLNVIYIISSCMVAAGAYLINDFYDKNIDAINHPSKVFPFSKNITWIVYFLLNIIALGLGLYAFSVEFSFVFLLLPIWGLWFYSFSLKRVAVIGNLTIAMMSVWLPLGVVLLNVPDLHLLGRETLSGEDFIQFEKYKSLILLLISCSFLATLSREIVKDIQDEKGDREMNCKTFPILVGKDFAIVCAAGLLTIASLIWGNFTIKNFATLGHAIVPFVITLVFLILGIFAMFYTKNWNKRTKLSSNLIKVAMVSALLAGFVF